MQVDGGGLVRAVELNPAPCLLIDADDHVVAANEAFVELTDLRVVDVIGEPVDHLLRAEGGRSSVRTHARSWLPVRVRERAADAPTAWRLLTLGAAELDVAESLTSVDRLIDALLDPTFLLEPVRKGGRIVDLRIVSGNEPFESITGVKLEVVIGTPIREISQADPEARESYERYVDVARTGSPARFSQAWRQAEELVATFDVSAQRVEGRVMVSFRDRMEGEAARRALHAAGRRLNALDEERRGLLAAKHDFLTMASHELRTPVATILGLAELLKREDDLDPAERHLVLDALVRNARRQSRIVASLVDASRLEEEGLSIVKAGLVVGAIIGDALRAVQGIADRVSVECPDDLTLVSDPERVQQILISFLTNAAKYGEDTPVSIRVRASDEEVRITVSDRGPGVPEDFVPHIFEMFTQAGHPRRRTARGVGLGLHVASAVASALGGAVSYEPVDPTGAAFTLTLPR